MEMPRKITVQGSFVKSDGTPETGSLEFYSKVYVMESAGQTALVPSVTKVDLDSLGQVHVELPATDDPAWSPNNWTYTLVLRLSGDFSSKEVVIPYNSPGAVLSVAQLVPTYPTGNVSGNYIPLTAKGAPNGVATLDGTGKIPSAQLPASSGGAPDWAEVLNKPTTFTPSAHTHAVLDVTGLQAILDGKQAAGSYAAATHTHTIANVTSLQTTLDGKAPVVHTHTVANVTGLQAALDGKQVAGSYVDQTAVDAKLNKVDPEIVDSTFTVKKANNSSGVRFRATGEAVDIDKLNGDIVISSFAGTDYSGAQTGLQRWRANGSTLAGYTEFGDTVYGGQQAIDGANGVAKLGAKNTLANIVLAGHKTSAGAPTTGIWAANDIVLATDGLWKCTAGGEPGTWARLSAAVTKADVGLGNVDNTADSAKPVSTAQQTALNLKAPLASPTFTGTVSGITKAMVGLPNVDNTSDANKPVSTATQTALDTKQPAGSYATTAALGSLDTRVTSVEGRTRIIVLGSADPVPGGTPAGTVIVRTV